MHDQPSQEPGERMDQLDRSLLATLTADDSHRPWSVDELARELGEDPSAPLARLQRAGLIHQLERFVWAARPAVRAQELHDV
jgi:predicted transcriptional regulator